MDVFVHLEAPAFEVASDIFMNISFRRGIRQLSDSQCLLFDRCCCHRRCVFVALPQKNIKQMEAEVYFFFLPHQ